MSSKAVNWKTELCMHYSMPGGCRKARCTYAHGKAELQPTPKNEKRKTKLCENFALYGKCRYNEKCWFIHPTDAESKFFVMQREFKRKVQELHKSRTHTNYLEVDDKIMRMVKKWNVKHPKGPCYFDFHGLTVSQAKKYVEEIISEMWAKEETVAKIETGRGNHSLDEAPDIRNMILTKYQGHPDVSFEPEAGNDGILILSFK